MRKPWPKTATAEAGGHRPPPKCRGRNSVGRRNRTPRVGGAHLPYLLRDSAPLAGRIFLVADRYAVADPHALEQQLRVIVVDTDAAVGCGPSGEPTLVDEVIAVEL